MQRLLRFATRLNYVLLAFWLFVWGGMMFGAAFVVDFIVENRTTETIWITPIGARGEGGLRGLLPLKLAGAPFHLPALRYTDFRLEPGETVTIHYDHDDVNLAEIVVRDAQGRWKQFIVDPRPAADRYHAPRQRRFDIAELDQLPPATDADREAIEHADAWARCAVVVYAIFFGPWLLHGVLAAAAKRWGRADAGPAPKAFDPCIGLPVRRD
jgi:hypothetical protein